MLMVNELELMQKQPNHEAASHRRRDPGERERRFQARQDRLRRSAEVMKELRCELDVSRAEVARKTGVTSSLIYSIERAETYFSAAQLKRILAAYPKCETVILEVVGKHLPELVGALNQEEG